MLPNTAARRSFDELVSDVVEREGFENNLEDVAFVAVSQGAIMALDAVARGRWKVGAGQFRRPASIAANIALFRNLDPAHARQCRQDLPSTASIAASGQLKSAEYDVSLIISPDVSHTISSGETSEAAIFLRDKFYR